MNIQIIISKLANANKKTILYIVVFLSLLALFYVKALKGGDFDVYLNAATRLKKGENIYAEPFYNGLKYYYSVAFALFLIPFTYFPIIGKMLWLLFSTWCAYRTWVITNIFINPKSVLDKKSYMIWVILLVFMVSRFLLYNIITLQLTLFLLWACFESIYLVEKGRNIKAAVLLGIAINIKLLPLAMLPYLIYRKHTNVALLALSVVGILFFLPVVFIGFDANHQLLTAWWETVNPVSQDNSLKGDKLMHCLTATIPAYVMPPIDGFQGRRAFLALSPENAKLVVNAIRLLLLSFTLYFLKWPPFKKSNSLLLTYWEISYILLLIPLVFPHQQKYSFWLILPAVAYLLLASIVTQRKLVQTFLFFVLLSMSPIIGRDIIGSHYYDLLQYYKVLTIATLLLIPFLIVLNPTDVFHPPKP